MKLMSSSLYLEEVLTARQMHELHTLKERAERNDDVRVLLIIVLIDS